MYMLKFILWIEIFITCTLCIKEFWYHKPSCGDGRRLISNTLSAVNVRSKVTCSLLCPTEEECQSFNLIKVKHNKYKYLCELKAIWDEDICSSELSQSDSSSTLIKLLKR